MTTNHDALREAQEEPFEKWWEEQGQYGRTGGVEYEKTFAWNAWCAALSQPMPEAPNPSADDIHSCSPFCTRPGCVADREANKPEPQAQAEEPDGIVEQQAVYEVCLAHWGPYNGVTADAKAVLELLKSHREAMESLKRSAVWWARAAARFEEAIAKKDAALQACVEAMKEAHEAMYSPRVQTQLVARVYLDCAIQQAEEARK